MNYRTFTALLRCKLCGAGIPVQGATRVLKCGACLAEHMLSAERVADLLHFASQGPSGSVGDDDLTWNQTQGHPCPSCETKVDLGGFHAGLETTISCKTCSTPITAFPPPAWLRPLLPTLEMIVGAERDADDMSVGELRAVVAQKPAPIVMHCPECGGSLKITADAARSVACDHCSANVFLPDDLWRTLHPIKRAAFWTVAFEPRALQRVSDIADDDRRAQETAAEIDRKRLLAEQHAAEQSRTMRAPMPTYPSSNGRRVVSYVIAGVIVVGVGVGVIIAAL